jgi:hypothetical protein
LGTKSEAQKSHDVGRGLSVRIFCADFLLNSSVATAVKESGRSLRVGDVPGGLLPIQELRVCAGKRPEKSFDWKNR